MPLHADLGSIAFGNGKWFSVQGSSRDMQGHGSGLAQLGDKWALRVGEDKKQGRSSCVGYRGI